METLSIENMYERLNKAIQLEFELKFRYLTYCNLQTFFKISKFQENNYNILLNDITLTNY